ncbi:MAG TPA: hypothetical protein VIM11_10285 [Tepidisphaeraceae bacterium]
MSPLLIQSLTVSVVAVTIRHQPASAIVPPPPPPAMDVLAVVGFLLAVVQLACFAHQHHSTALLFGLGLSAVGIAVYAALQGAWPLGMIQMVWAVAAFRRWSRQIRDVKPARRDSAGAALFWPISSEGPAPHLKIDTESRMSRMFGPL